MPKYQSEKALKARTICQICDDDKPHTYLGSHLRQHKISAKEYKETFGLPFTMPLTDPDLEKTQREMNEKNEGHKNLLKHGTKYRFKKGHHKNKTRRISAWTQEEMNERIQKQNEKIKQTTIQCPLCASIKKNIISHCYEAHGIYIYDHNKFFNTTL
jgi:hypothetical protein